VELDVVIGCFHFFLSHFDFISSIPGNLGNKGSGVAAVQTTHRLRTCGGVGRSAFRPAVYGGADNP